MKKSKKKKPKLRPPSPIQSSTKISVGAPERSRLRGALAAILSVISLLAAIGGILTLLPRLTVEGTGDFAHPASIAFKLTNTNFVPLHNVGYRMYVCALAYGGDSRAANQFSCDWDRLRQVAGRRLNPITWEWIEPDRSETMRLEDFIGIRDKPIEMANLVIEIWFQPWYIPWRQPRNFGFETARGTDGLLYWRTYQPPPAIFP